MKLSIRKLLNLKVISKKTNLNENSTSRKVINNLKKHKLGLFSLYAIILFYVITFTSDFLVPYSYKYTNKNYLFVPPTKIHFRHQGKFKGPFVYASVKSRNKVTYEIEYSEDTSKIYPIKLFVKGDSYKFFWIFKLSRHLFGIEKNDEAIFYLWGGDKYGRDIFSRVFIGGKVSLTAGILGALISVVLGAIIGAFSGYYGGKTDMLIQRLIEIIRSFPRLPLWLTLSLLLPPTINSVQVYFGIIILLSLIEWTSVARVVRGLSLSLKDSNYVLAAKLFNISDIKIIFRHIIPNVTTYLIIISTITIPILILAESTISFLGLGIKEPMSSWGLMLKDVQSLTLIASAPWLMIPGIFIVLSVLLFNIFGDALRDALDPNGIFGKVAKNESS